MQPHTLRRNGLIGEITLLAITVLCQSLLLYPCLATLSPLAFAPIPTGISNLEQVRPLDRVRARARARARTNTIPKWRTLPSLLGKRKDEDGVDKSTATTNDTNDGGLFPCLPPIGESSYTSRGDSTAPFATEAKKSAFVGDKFELQYTCKICETRNSNRVSRMAYREGVVIVVCKGCSAKHLIADNLGWHNYIGGFEDDMNIEEYLASRGKGDDVKRVSPDVFELEKIIRLKRPPGSRVTNDSDGFE